jgi:hypothetical protein
MPKDPTKPTLNETTVMDICIKCGQIATCFDFSAEYIRERTERIGHKCCYDIPFRSNEQLKNLKNELVAVFYVGIADDNHDYIIVRDPIIYLQKLIF